MSEPASNEKPMTEAQLEQRRAAARRPRPAARRAKDVGEADALTEALTAIRKAAPQAARRLVKLLEAKEHLVATKAATEILDRAGIARRSEVGPLVEQPKMFLIADPVRFPDPPNWNGRQEPATPSARNSEITT